jgi:hypothetical protein
MNKIGFYISSLLLALPQALAVGGWFGSKGG